MHVGKNISIQVLILALLLPWASLSTAATYAHGIYVEKKSGFSIRVPEDWERTLTSGNQADTHLFVSPDKQVAVGVSVYGRAGDKTNAALLDLFRAEGLSGSKQLQEQQTALNGRGGLLRAYALPKKDGDPIIAVAVAISTPPKGYVVWHMISAPRFEKREPEASAVLDTFLIRPDTQTSAGANSKSAPHASHSLPAEQVPDFFGGMPSDAGRHPEPAEQHTAKPGPAVGNRPGSVPNFFGGTPAPPSIKTAKPTVPPSSTPPAPSSSAGSLDLTQFPLFMEYELGSIPPALAARPAAENLPIPKHDSIKKSVGAGGYDIREFRQNGTPVASERRKNGALKGVMLWTPDRKGRVFVEFWKDGTVSTVKYYEGMYKQGISRFWDTDGTLAQIVTYRDNKQDGPPKIVWLRNKNHTLRSVEYRKKGKRHGLFRTYHRNGQLEEESHWDNGVRMRQELYYISGELRAKMRHKNGKSVGAFYNKDGTIQTKYE